MRNKFKNIFTIIRAYFLAAAVLSVVLILIIAGPPVSFYLSISIICVIGFLFLIVQKKRTSELTEIKDTIYAIRKNTIESAEDIRLSPGLNLLEQEIRDMYIKAKTDIEYLKKLERIRTEFLANVSHELRTPVFTIQGYLETLIDGAVHDEGVNIKFLEKANQHAVNLSHLVNDLIDISMMEAGEMRMSFRYFEINPFLREIINEFSHAAEGKNLLLNLVEAREGYKVYGDKTRLKQVVVNLIANAIKYTDEGRIDICVEEEAKRTRIMVKDTGIGISEADAARIFERFYRVDKARSRAEGGTGLGLAIVKHIIEAHGSRIEIKSTPQKGSEFYFYLRK